MTAKEEDILTSRALIKNGTVITQLLKSCILNKLVDPDDMLTGDKNAILIGIRVTGYGSEYSAKITCPHCNKEYETYSVDLSADLPQQGGCISLLQMMQCPPLGRFCHVTQRRSFRPFLSIILCLRL